MKKPTLFKKVDLSKIFPRASKKGSMPGQVEYLGKPRTDKVKVMVSQYSQDKLITEEVVATSKLRNYLDPKTTTWFSAIGVHDSNVIQDIGAVFNIHPLVLEDIANTSQRPKLEEYEDYIYLVLNSVSLHPKTREVVVEQVSIILGENYVITFQETENDVLNFLELRLDVASSRLRKSSADYFVFAVADLIIDDYFHILENIGEKIEDIEEMLVDSVDDSVQKILYRLRRRLVYLKRPIWPTRDIMNQLQKIEHKLISEEIKIYFRDTHDHTIQIIETLESAEDMTSSLMDLYLTMASHRMNQIMKVLTIYAAIFIPLTFITGVYGMNFEHLPELTWQYGYAMFWGLIIVITASMVIYFKIKKWF
jgi:magnesium transporter